MCSKILAQYVCVFFILSLRLCPRVFVLLSCFPCLNNHHAFRYDNFSLLSIDCQIDSVILREDEKKIENDPVAAIWQWLNHSGRKNNLVEKHWKTIRTFRIWLLFFSSISSSPHILIVCSKIERKKNVADSFQIWLPHLNFWISYSSIVFFTWKIDIGIGKDVLIGNSGKNWRWIREQSIIVTLNQNILLCRK